MPPWKLRIRRVVLWLYSAGAAVPSAAAAQVAAGAQPKPVMVVRTSDVNHVTEMAASPDGAWYVTISGGAMGGDGRATIWRASDGFEYRTFAAGKGLNPTIAVAPDGHTIASAYDDEVRLYDARTTKQTGTLRTAQAGGLAGAGIMQVAFHPSRMLIASLDLNGTVLIRDSATGAELFRRQIGLDLDRICCWAMHYSPDGRLLAVVSPTTIHVYTWETNRELSFDAHTQHLPNLSRTMQAMVINPGSSGVQRQTAEQIGLYQFNDAAFSPDSQRIALVHKDEIDVMDLAGGKQLDAVPVLDHEAQTCFFSTPDTIVAGLLAGDSFRYDLSTHGRAAFEAWGVKQFLVLPHSSMALMNLGDRVGIKSVSGTGAWASFTSAALADPTHFVFAPTGSELLEGVNWGTSPMTAWDLSSGEADTRTVPMAGVENFAVSPDGRRIAYYGSEGYGNEKVHVWNRVTRTEERALPITVTGMTMSLAFSADGKQLAALIGEPKAARVWSVPDGAEIATVPITEDVVNKVAWSPASDLLAVSQKTGIVLVDTSKAPGRVVRTIDPQQGAQFRGTYGDLHFSPDGKTLASGAMSEIKLIDVASGAVTSSIPNAWSLCFAYAPDGRVAYLPQVSDRYFQIHTTGVALWDTAAKKIVAQDAANVTGCPESFTKDGRFVATARAGGSGVQIVDTATGEVRATLLRFGNGEAAMDWMVVTPDGLFDGTPGAWGQISWRFADNTFDVAPAEVFFQEFFRPGLLADILAERAVAPPPDIAAIDRRQPQVQLTQTSDITGRTAHLSLAVSESREAKGPGMHSGGSGARDLRLFRNGTLVRVWRGEVKLDAKGGATFTADVPIEAGENRFTAYAFNRDNVKSADAVLQLTGPPTLARKGTAYVIAIGINQYAAHASGKLNNLSFAEADAKDFATQFQVRQQALEQFGSVEVTPLLGADATRSRIVAAIQALAAKVQPEDGVFLFYAGHGVASEGHFYLLPQDFDPSAQFSDARSRAISEMELSTLLEPVSPARSFLVIDACNSGEALGGDKYVPGPMNSTGLAQLAYEKGLYILAASQGRESAMESANLGSGHGYLTYALVEEGLRTEAAAEAGTVLLRPWFEFASRRVPALQSGSGARGFELQEDPSTAASAGRQHPKVFYRREPEATPFVVAKPAGPGVPAAQP